MSEIRIGSVSVPQDSHELLTNLVYDKAIQKVRDGLDKSRAKEWKNERISMLESSFKDNALTN